MMTKLTSVSDFIRSRWMSVGLVLLAVMLFWLFSRNSTVERLTTSGSGGSPTMLQPLRGHTASALAKFQQIHAGDKNLQIDAENLIKSARRKMEGKEVARWHTSWKTKRGVLISETVTVRRTDKGTTTRTDYTATLKNGLKVGSAMLSNAEGKYAISSEGVVFLPTDSNGDDATSIFDKISSDGKMLEALSQTPTPFGKVSYAVAADPLDPNLVLIHASENPVEPHVADALTAILSKHGNMSVTGADLQAYASARFDRSYLVDPRSQEILVEYSSGSDAGSLLQTTYAQDSETAAISGDFFSAPAADKVRVVTSKREFSQVSLLMLLPPRARGAADAIFREKK